MRIGHSFDLHTLGEGDGIILGGIKIPAKVKAIGHSDADVLLHTIIESIIGAVGKGDIGDHFSDKNIANKGILSVKMLEQIITMYEVEIINLDSTIYLEAPYLNQYKNDIKTKVAEILKIDENQVNIKATTYEKMDSIGTGKAIAAETVILLKTKEQK